MLLHLLKQCEQDHDYVVIPCLKGLSNKLTGLFWMISQQQNELWSKFHDVVIYDSTAKTNRVLAQTLIKYETQADYNWILCYILEATHIFPAVLFTDEDLAMNAAIQVVEESDLSNDIIEHLYNTSQICIQKFLSDILNNEIEKL
uniref:Uncharacterized protein n=1 Tax=Rhizophagus irregularis (strain DAOM 181602 / DAOM 197198 / MUCL 43194) TaxID=747089 RepID=U9TYU5_RHIID